MGGRTPQKRDVLLAVALGSRRRMERRVRSDRRSGIERRTRSVEVAEERRSGTERRQLARCEADHDEGPTRLQKARTVLTRRRSGLSEGSGR
jgi:hypothetical protein